MNLPNLSQFRMSEPYWRGVILIISAAVILFTIWCLSLGITIIFMHLYYFPIVLLAYRYRYRGFVLATLLSLAYVGLVVIYHPEQAEITGALYRFAVFIGIAVVTASLSEQLATVQLSQKQRLETIRNLQQFQESVIANANIWISVLAPNGALIIWNDAAEAISGYQKSDVVGKRTIWKKLYPDNAYRKKVTGDIQRIIERDTFLENFETEIRCADGTTKTIVWNTRSMRDAQGKVTSYIAIGRDISAQKAAEFLAAESSRFLATLIDTLPLPVFFKDVNGRYLGCNPPFEEYIGIKRDQLIGKTAYDLFPEDLADTYTAADQQVFADLSPRHYETQVQYIDGSRHDVILFRAPFLHNDGSVAGLIGVFLDISDRKRMEEKLRVSEEKFHDIFNNINDAIEIHLLKPGGLPGKYIDVNDVGCRMLQYTRSEILELSPLDISTDFHNPPLEEIAKDLIIKGSSKFETEHRRKDGIIIPVEINAHVTCILNQEVVVAAVRDISERKLMEESLRESHQILQTVLDTIPVRVFWKDRNLKYLGCNRPFAQDAGFTEPEALIGKDDYAMGWRDQAEIYRADDRSVITSGKAKVMIEEPQETPDGRIIWLLTSKVPLRDARGEISGVLGAYMDISEYRNVKEAIRESEEKYKTFFATSKDCVFITSKDGRFVDFNDETPAFFGYRDREEFGTVKVQDLYSNASERQEHIRAIEQSGFVKDYPVDLRKKDGSIIHALITSIVRKDISGKVIGFQGTIKDVTEQRRAEDALRGSEQKFRDLFENSRDGIVVVDIKTQKFIDSNEMFSKLLGYNPEEIKNLSIRDIHPEDNLPHIFKIFEKMVRYETDVAGNIPVKRKDGTLFYADISMYPISISNKGYLVGVFRDITERKRVEETLRDSQNRSAMLLEAIPDMMFIISRDGVYRDFSVPDSSVLVVPVDQIIGTNIRDSGFKKESTDAIIHYIGLTLDTKKLHQFEYDLVVQDGEHRYEARMVALNEDSVLGIVRDITERKRAEEALRESRQLSEDIISFLPDPTFVIDKDGKVLAWNRALEQLSGVSAGDIIGKGDHEYSLWSYGKRRPLLIDLVLHPDQDAGRQNYTGIRWEGRSVLAQTELIRPGGHRISFMLVASPLIDPYGETTGAIESMRDITRLKDTEAELARINQNLEKIVRERTKELEDEVTVRKQAEAAIRASLDEKVILLREIHHRVKNNLQIIISLTNLQMRQAEDPVVKEIMAETQSRVRAMALVHEKLYGSKSLSRIDFADYTRFLATQHLSYYGSGTKNIRLVFVMSEIMVDINTAVPLGLVMNELISNALKHAFPNGMEGMISLRGRDDGNLITIVVKDNGIGIPADFDWKNTTSLGMRLIISLVDQLNGTIDMDSGEGTTFRIRIPKNSAF